MHEVHVNMFSLTSIYGVNLLNTMLELKLFWRQILIVFYRMAYRCDMCGKSYKHKRNLKRHIKERINDSEHWNCIEEGCSSRFIRRSYLSKHLVWIHGYNQDDARETVLSAPRGDKPKQYGEFEDISEDDSILDLLAERDATLISNEFYDKIEDFNTDLFDQQTTSTGADTSFDAMCDIDIEVLEYEKVDSLQSNASGYDSDTKGKGDKNGDGISDRDDNIAQGNDDNLAHGNDDIIYISSDEECRDVEVSQLRVKRQTFILTFTRRMKYINGTEVDCDMHLQSDFYEEFD